MQAAKIWNVSMCNHYKIHDCPIFAGGCLGKTCAVIKEPNHGPSSYDVYAVIFQGVELLGGNYAHCRLPSTDITIIEPDADMVSFLNYLALRGR